MFTDFLSQIDTVHIILTVVVLVFLALVLYLLDRMSRLRRQQADVQLHFTDKRRVVYEGFMTVLQQACYQRSSGMGIDIDDDLRDQMTSFGFDLMLWGSDDTVWYYGRLQDLVLHPGKLSTTPPKKLLQLIMELVMSLRADLGYANKGLSWKRLSTLMIDEDISALQTPQTEGMKIKKVGKEEEE